MSEELIKSALLISLPFWYGYIKGTKSLIKLIKATTEVSSGYRNPAALTRNLLLFFSVMLAIPLTAIILPPLSTSFVLAWICTIPMSLCFSSIAAFTVKQAFRLGVYITNKIQKNKTESLTNTGKYYIGFPEQHSTSAILLKSIAKEKQRMVASSQSGYLCRLAGIKSLFFEPKIRARNDELNEAIFSIHNSPSQEVCDDLCIRYNLTY